MKDKDHIVFSDEQEKWQEIYAEYKKNRKSFRKSISAVVEINNDAQLFRYYIASHPQMLCNKSMESSILDDIVINYIHNFKDNKKIKTYTNLTSSSDSSHSPNKIRPSKLLGILDLFKWFCGKENREDVEFTRADFCRDEKSMRAEGRGRIFIFTVLSFQIFRAIVPIAWDGFMRVLKQAAKAAGLMRRIRFK